MSERGERFPLIDSLRALAALSVLLVHGTNRDGALQHKLGGVPHLLVANLYVGVPIFFLISGFLLYRPFAAATIGGNPGPRVGYYAWRRVLRIVPAYWVALTLMALLLGMGYVFSARRGPVFYGFGQSYSARTTNLGIGPAWTLCVEMTFYAFLPAFAMAVRALPGATVHARLRNQLSALCMLFFIAIAWTAWALSKSDPNTAAGQPLLDALPAYFDHFALGMGLAVLSIWLGEGRQVPAVLRLVERTPSAAWIAAAALWLVSIPVAPDPGYRTMTSLAYIGKHVLFGFVAVGVLLPAIVGAPSRGAVRRLLANRKLLWVGLVSYGVYLYHQPLDILLLRWHLRGAALGLPLVTVAARVVILLALSLTVAALSYYMLERPAMRLRHVFEPARKPRGGEPSARNRAGPVGPR
jgi:peptidoglycan/LPS O-acetylase OafA/YrhL